MAYRKSRKSGPSKKRNSGKQQKKRGPEYVGKVQMTREGYIFVIVEGSDDDIFVKASRVAGALNGDTVRVEVTKEKGDRGHREGRVVEIVERSRRPFVGILHVVGQQAWVLMESRTMPYDISVPIEQVRELDAKSGFKVAAYVDEWPKKAPNPVGHIVDVLGLPGENDTEMHAILAEYALPYRFEPEVEKAAEAIPDRITDNDLKGRRDFRDTLTFTIDPADSKDFDDALSFKELPDGNVEVGIHIADVTYYVRPGSVLDKEAQSRSTSVYLVDRTVPMLPEKLSNKMCSLRPGEDKLTFSAVFTMTRNGKVIDSWFGRTVINSDYRFAYETAQQIIDAGPEAMTLDLCGGTDGSNLAADSDGVINGEAINSASAMGQGITTGMRIPDSQKAAILALNDIALKLRTRRFDAGAVNFERPEMKVEIDEKGRPVNVCQKISKEANWLIEEFMLLANRSVAEFVARQNKTFVYRVHDEPNQEKLDGLRSFIRNFGYTMGPTSSGRDVSRELNNLFKAAKDKPELNAIELLSLRTMAKACYSIENIGHYGLAFDYYTHFTSPIRRYPDMMVHRLLAQYLDKAPSQKADYYENQCKYASEREVVAADAERASIKYKLVEFMQDKVGAEFEGHISGLTEWGMYVEIEPTKIEGMVALRDIKSDFFEFDEERYRIVGRRSRIVYTLGDPVRIRVKATNLEQKLLDYELVETGLEERIRNEKASGSPSQTDKSADGAPVKSSGRKSSVKASTKSPSGSSVRKARKSGSKSKKK